MSAEGTTSKEKAFLSGSVLGKIAPLIMALL